MADIFTAKLILSYNEQIAHLKEKGVTFDKFSEDEAKIYLSSHNNLFRLLAYRQDFKDPDSDNYRGLDFSYLVHMARIDRELREFILEACLDIEHFSKMQLLNLIVQVRNHEKANVITGEYFSNLQESDKKDGTNRFSSLCKTISVHSHDIYLQGLYCKYTYCTENTPCYDHFPVWAFLEVIPFREFIYFYQFCITEIRSKHYQQYRALTFLLKTVNRARNAAAHNSCLINDLKLITGHPSKDSYIKEALPEKCRSYLKYAKPQQIIACLYLYKEIVTKEYCKDFTFLSRPYDYGNADITTQLNSIYNILESFNETVPEKLNYKLNFIKDIFYALSSTIASWYPNIVK